MCVKYEIYRKYHKSSIKSLARGGGGRGISFQVMLRGRGAIEGELISNHKSASTDRNRCKRLLERGGVGAKSRNSIGGLIK